MCSLTLIMMADRLCRGLPLIVSHRHSRTPSQLVWDSSGIRPGVVRDMGSPGHVPDGTIKSAV